MPSRPWTVAIVALWLGTNGWLLLHDVLPRWRASRAAPFTIDLSREAANGLPVKWDVFHNGETAGTAITWTHKYRRSDNTYLLETDIRFTNYRYGPIVGTLIQLSRMRSKYRVDGEGHLHYLEAEVYGSVTDPVGGHHEGMVRVDATAVDDVITPVWTLKVPGLFTKQQPTPPVRVPNQYSILNPLQPWDRLENLRPGQHWRIVRFDPLTQSLAALLGREPEAEMLDAGVKEELEDFVWEGKPFPCLVIECHGANNLVARTYVRASDGLVLRQEAERQESDRPEDNERFAMERSTK